jgi:hypothetical protein
LFSLSRAETLPLCEDTALRECGEANGLPAKKIVLDFRNTAAIPDGTQPSGLRARLQLARAENLAIAP